MASPALMTLDPKRTAFLFPGQGSQSVGMGLALAESEPLGAQVFAEADRILGIDLSGLCWHGPADTLNDTVNTQPALLTHSVAVLRALQSRNPDLSPAYVAGHSLGEFSALVAAGAMDFPEALRLVRERGRVMKAAGEQSPGGMVAVLGLDIEAIEDVCREASTRSEGTVQVANDNCPGQVVISGDEKALSYAAEELRARGARRVIRLAVSIAAHSPLMMAAQSHFNRALHSTPLLSPSLPVIGNVNAAPMNTAEEVRADLGAQLTARVRWTESIRALITAGVRNFIEVGPGSVLTGLVRRIDPTANALVLDTPESFGQLAD